MSVNVLWAQWEIIMDDIMINKQPPYFSEEFMQILKIEEMAFNEHYEINGYLNSRVMGTRIIHTASGSKLERGNKMDEQTIKLQCMDRAIATLASNPVVTKVLPLAKEFYAWVSDSKTNTLYFENVSTERKKD